MGSYIWTCPNCGKRLLQIDGRRGEYICPNDDCLANKKLKEFGLTRHAEFIGDNQEEINEQRR